MCNASALRSASDHIPPVWKSSLSYFQKRKRDTRGLDASASTNVQTCFIPVYAPHTLQQSLLVYSSCRMSKYM